MKLRIFNLENEKVVTSNKLDYYPPKGYRIVSVHVYVARKITVIHIEKEN